MKKKPMPRKERKVEVLSSIVCGDGKDFSYCGWVDMKRIKGKRRIIAIYQELGREGGMTWSADGHTSNGNLKECMYSIGRKWPKLYTRVRELCPAEMLPSIHSVSRDATKRQLEIARRELKLHEQRVSTTKAKIRKLEKQLS